MENRLPSLSELPSKPNPIRAKINKFSSIQQAPINGDHVPDKSILVTDEDAQKVAQSLQDTIRVLTKVLSELDTAEAEVKLLI